jgi:hypothetical protein
MKYTMNLLGGLALMLVMLASAGCKEEKWITYYDPDAPAPQAINPSSVKIENFPGKSIIRYGLPKDDNLLYVKAVYETAPGVLRESKASFYIDTLALEGFGAAGNFNVKIVSVGKNEKESEAVNITVSPQTPPVMEAFKTVNLSAVFGGVKGDYKNDSKTELKAVLLLDSAGDGNYTQLRAFVCNRPISVFTYTGLKATPSNFAIYLQDRYGNRSDTARYKGLTPLYEEKIENEKWTWYQTLPSDMLLWTEMHSNIYAPWRMWDNDLAASWDAVYVVDNVQSALFPYTLTISLGDSYLLSRIILHHWRMHTGGYTGGAPKSFQVWGSNLEQPGDDLFGGDWNLLGDFESEIPSGNASPTQADKDLAVFDGDPFFFEANDVTPEPYLPPRFVRFRFRGSWNGRGIGDVATIWISEVRLFGQKINN